MKIIMFGDEESVNLLHLIGMDGIIFEKDDGGFEEKFEEVTEDPDVGIIIISERLLVKYREIIYPFKMQKRLPIIVEIPSIMPEFKEDYTKELARKYIGIDI
jgi:V/A-type H+-transporting ATPase subunit F